jgi:oligopeptide/dipeptide ABC transporter ATP-binding protein
LTDNQTVTPLLSVRGLEKTFSSGPPWRRRHVQAVRGVSFDVLAGHTFGLVGESGSGKSTTGRAIARLITPTAGTVRFDGQDVSTLKGGALKRWRQDIGFIFQDPYGSLDSRMTVGEIITEPLLVHGTSSRASRAATARELIDEVGLPSTALTKFPHEFSGGQRQRIAIARAIALRPKLVIADEPVSALDVSVQASVLNLFKDLQQRHGLAYLFISHDLDVVEFMSDEIAVMYLGEISEVGPAIDVFTQPAHPYSRALLAAAPSIDTAAPDRSTRLRGEIPSPDNPPSGCSFHTRCPRAEALCTTVVPPVRSNGPHQSRCHFADPGGVGVIERAPGDDLGTVLTKEARA